jgi:hypothetical protein
MAVQYIRLQPITTLFSPAVRAYGNIAIIGDGGTAPKVGPNIATLFTNPADAATAFPAPPPTSTVPNPPLPALSAAIAMAFQQSPGPTLVYGVAVATVSGAPDWAAALTVVSSLDVQLVVLANVALDSTSGNPGTSPGAIVQLARHVASVSTTGGDGKERMGVAMLAKGSTDTTIVTGDLANERMVYIAHKSDEDAAAAVAGTIAGYEPSVSLLLKPVNITTGLFTSAEISTINGAETFSSGPAGQGVNWFASPSLLPGGGIYMGEGYTGNPGGKKYIDIVRTIDDVSFQLKARLIRSIGALRISRSGLRSLVAQMEAVLEPYVSNEVIESYDIVIPVLILLDKDPASLTSTELTVIQNAQSDRVVEVLVAVEYAGAIHRLAITLKFE